MQKYILTIIAASAALCAMAQAPGAVKLSPRARMAAVKPAQELNAYVCLTPGADTDALEALGVKVIVRAGDIITARVPQSVLDALGKLPEVEYVQVSAPATQMLDLAKSETGAGSLTLKDADGVTTTYNGTGVVVGIVDAGFDYLHESFTDPAGALRIARVWEQNGTPGTYQAPEKYGYGIELATPEQIRAAAGDISGNSHGTHVATIAAGSSAFRDGRYAGIAPGAEIVLVSMGDQSRDNVNISNGIAYIFDYAASVGKPCVVNLSLGNQAGPHDGTSMFDQVADTLTGPGKLIVGSAGNHGNDLFHVSKTFASTDDAPLQTFIDFRNRLSEANAGGDIEVWADKGTQYKLELVCYNTSMAKEIEAIPVDFTVSEPQTLSFEKNATGALTVTCETNPLNGKQHALITSGITNLRNNYHVALRITPVPPGKVDVWADNIYCGLSDLKMDGFTAPVPGQDATIAEIGGTADNILTVGSYTTRSEYTRFGQTEPSTLSGETVNAFSTFSSFGPTADGRQKPEITAPGCFIISSASANDAISALYLADVNDADPAHTNYYAFMQGTSMASPFVAGVVATWLQACPGLDPAQLKEIASATARADENVQAGPAVRWGAGKIGAYDGLLRCLDLSGVRNISADRKDGLVVRQQGRILSVNASSPLCVYNAADQLVLTAPASAAEIDATGLPSGIYILRAGTASAKIRL